jgi:hypothetical protein
MLDFGKLGAGAGGNQPKKALNIQDHGEAVEECFD